MDVETKAGWIFAVRQLAKAIEGGGDVEITSESISDASAVGKEVLTASTAAAARTAIGAGTSNLTLGTTASTAKAGNYVPTWGEVTGKPAVIASGETQAAARAAIGAGTSSLVIGTTASTAKAGNYAPTTSEVSSALSAKTQIAALTEVAAEGELADVISAVNAIIAALKA